MKSNPLSNRREKDLNSQANNNRSESKNYLDALISESEVHSVKVEECSEWEYANRNDVEMGDLKELSVSIKNNTQLQPGLIVPRSEIFKPSDESSNAKYIIIAGRRRYKACQIARCKYLAIIRNNLDIESALEIQRIENSERKDISNYSEGTSFYNAIQDGKTTFQNIINKSSMSKTTVGRLLSYGRLQDDFPDIYNSIGSFYKISYGTAAEILRLANKGHQDKLIKHSKQIRLGIGFKKLKQLIESEYPIELTIKKDGKDFIYLKDSSLRINKNIFELSLLSISQDIDAFFNGIIEKNA